MVNEPKLGMYRHYKGDEMRVIGTARHSETLEKLVVYEHFGAVTGLFVRPLEMFMEDVEVNGKTVPRFEYLRDS